MLVLHNGQDRTLGHFVRLAKEAGWKVVEVHHTPGYAWAQYVSVPIENPDGAQWYSKM